VLIYNNDQLKQFFLKSQKDKIIGIDTEFFRVSTYYPKLCLIQLANKTSSIIIDPLSYNINLSLIRKILFSKEIIKIFHAAYQDIEILFNLFGKIPKNIIDTQICLSEIGYANSMGYADACKNLLNVNINKKNQFIDWRKRPLEKEKIQYAIADVKYLPKLFLKINEKINIRQNINILENHKKLFNEEIFRKKSEKAWEKLKINRNNKYEIQKLKKICFLREELAKEKNMPVKKIITDQKIKLLCRKEFSQKDKKLILEDIKFDCLKKNLKSILKT
jgi:ribonuclease D